MIAKIKMYRQVTLILGLFIAGFIMFVAPKAGAISYCLTTTQGGPAPVVTDCQDVKNSLPGTLQDGDCYNVSTGNQGTSATQTDCTKEPFASYIKGGSCPSDPSQAICRTPDLASTSGVCVDSTGAATGGNRATACGFVDLYVKPLINVLAAAVGLIVTIMIVIGGVQYSAAGGDPAKVVAARQKITNAIFALVAFGLIYAALQWLIPGGIGVL